MFKVYTALLNCTCRIRVRSELSNNSLCFLKYPKIANSLWQPPMRCLVTEDDKRENILKSTTSENRTSNHKEEIYTGPLSKKLQILKITTSTTSLVALFILKDIHSRVEFSNQAVMICTLGMLLFFNFLTPFLINLFSKKYCVRIFYDYSRQEYTAEFYTYLFKKTSITFTPEDVVLPNFNKFFIIAYIKGYPLFFDVNHFKSVEFYKNIMGYDKPIDLKLEQYSENMEKQE